MLKQIRITPAYAGQILLFHFLLLSCQDHPRIRGTNYQCTCYTLLHSGSPPHTRDKFNSLTGKFGQNRITPAYAGQIILIKLQSQVQQDHPRIRGTNELIYSMIKAIIGSPPHTRDKYLADTSSTIAGGITPAYAGQIKGTVNR